MAIPGGIKMQKIENFKNTFRKEWSLYKHGEKDTVKLKRGFAEIGLVTGAFYALKSIPEGYCRLFPISENGIEQLIEFLEN